MGQQSDPSLAEKDAPHSAYDEMLRTLRDFGRDIGAGTYEFDAAQLRKLDTAAMALIVAINMRRISVDKTKNDTAPIPAGKL